MDKIEVGADVFLDLEGFIWETLLPFFSSLIWLIIIVFVLLKSYQGIKRKIKGSNYIFWGLISSFLFSLISGLLLSLIEQTIYNHPAIPSIIEFISISILLVSGWGFKVLIDSLNMHKIETNT